MRSLGHYGPIEDDGTSNKGPKKGAAAARFPPAAIKILKNWMIVHNDHPYPTEEEKDALKLETGLTVGQVSNWMANTRRRQKTRPRRALSPSMRASGAIDIPEGRAWNDLSMYHLTHWLCCVIQVNVLLRTHVCGLTLRCQAVVCHIMSTQHQTNIADFTLQIHLSDGNTLHLRTNLRL
jgi:hypothetical protein